MTVTVKQGGPRSADSGPGEALWPIFPNPPSGPTAPLAYSAADKTEIILTACGFTLGFGWLWFPILSAHWLPAFLWGRPLAGGGSSLFLGLLASGLLLYGLISRRQGRVASSPSAGPDSAAGPGRPGEAPGLMGFHWAHATALLTSVLEIVPALSAWEAPPSLRVAALAVAALAMGIFWGGRLLSLPPAKAGWAMGAAFAAGLLLALPLTTLCPFSKHGFCLALPLALAWLTAWALERLHNKPRPETKRSRGRPPKKNPAAADRPQPAWTLSQAEAGLVIAAFFLMSLNYAEQGGSAVNVWPAQALAALGAVGAMFLFRAAALDRGRPGGLIQELNPARPQIPLCLALALQGAGQLLAPGFFNLPAKFLMGATCLLTTLILAGAPPPVARRRAALVLGLALVLSNSGTEAVDRLIRALNTVTCLQPLITEPGARLSGLIVLLAALILWALNGQPGSGKTQPAPNRLGRKEAAQTEAGDRGPACSAPAPENSAAPAGTAVTSALPCPVLTAREEEIMRLAVRGCGNRHIAEQLKIQEATVRFHLRNIYKKTGLKNRKGLLALADQLELKKKSP